MKHKNANFILVIAIFILISYVCFIIDPMFSVGVIFGALLLYFGFPNFQKEFLEPEPIKQTSFLDTEILQQNFQIPQNLPIPYAVLDMTGHLLMYNEYFARLFPEIEKVYDIIPLFMKDLSKEIYIEIQNRSFLGSICLCDIEEEHGAIGTVFTFTLFDISKQTQLEQTLQNNQTVFGILLIDNYTEVTEQIDTNKIPIFHALIERKCNQIAKSLDGVVRPLEKDKYLFILTKAQLQKLQEQKFDEINRLKEVTVGEHIPITFSFGMGLSKQSLDQSMQNAKNALHLCLGRGGDQIIIKEEEEYTFFGGTAQEKEKSTRIRSRVKADALQNLMMEASSVLVMGHSRADLDSLGSCLGIFAIARSMHIPCHIILNENSAGISKLLERLEDEELLEDIFLNTKQSLALLDSKTLLVIVDTHRVQMLESPEVFQASKNIVLFDHHRKSPDAIENCVLVYHEPFASSTSELITEMIQHIGKKIKLTPIEADALLAGITVDTKNFCVKTGAITFEMAGFLKRNGADGIRVRLLFQNDLEAYKAKASTVHNAEIFQDTIAISVCPNTTQNPTLITAQSADDLMNINHIIASFVCCELEDTIYISARSFGAINVQRVMEQLGGGGHHTVSGAQLKNCTLEEAKEKIKTIIIEYLKEDLP